MTVESSGCVVANRVRRVKKSNGQKCGPSNLRRREDRETGRGERTKTPLKRPKTVENSCKKTQETYKTYTQLLD
ncbi:unnamed protein product [Dovyalis caffra]|uniref:Uncharacterized protein n=1 Tax=Dovyalis caffra TaxID=77055 RepID=A0AAV1SAG4_9ROSI|nr:unnamed protein product [Dovyalis caffra]